VANALSNAKNPSQPIDATLPSWTDAQAITSYITSLAGLGLGLAGALNPSWGTAPKWLAPAAALAGFVIATGAQIFNYVSHRGVNKAALNAHGAIRAAAINASNGDPTKAAQLAAVVAQPTVQPVQQVQPPVQPPVQPVQPPVQPVQPPLQITTPTVLPKAKANSNYETQLTSQGGTPPILWEIPNGDAGDLQLDPNTGILTGAANVMVPGDLKFQITATDSSNPSRSVPKVVQLRTN
jgi:hypothetical protein